MRLECKHDNRECIACLPDNTSLWLCHKCYKDLSIQNQANIINKVFASQSNGSGKVEE